MKKLNFYFFVLLSILPLYTKATVDKNFCQGIFQSREITIVPGKTVKVKPTELVVRGKLEAFWETGMEGITGWSVYENDLASSYKSTYDALHILRRKDYLFIISKDNQILAEGYFKERLKVSTINLFGSPIEVANNIPQLYRDSGFRKQALDSSKLKRYFYEGARGVAIIKATEPWYLEKIKNQNDALKLYNEHMKNPNRFITVAPLFVYEGKPGEKVIPAVIKKVPRPANRNSAQEGSELYYYDIVDTKGNYMSTDKIFVVNQKGELVEEIQSYNTGDLKKLYEFQKENQIYAVIIERH